MKYSLLSIFACLLLSCCLAAGCGGANQQGMFIALGLPETAPFWSDPAAPWTSKKAWEGVDLPVDHAIRN